MIVDPERRQHVRTRCNMQAFISATDHPSRTGVVCDVSERGVGLSTMEHYCPGHWIYLALPDEAPGFLPLQVTRIRYERGVGWFLGCVFASLTNVPPTPVERDGTAG